MAETCSTHDEIDIQKFCQNRKEKSPHGRPWRRSERNVREIWCEGVD
jgi:hypothetical protein